MNPDDSTEDTRDPFVSAFGDYKRAPADVVPRTNIAGDLADLEALAGTMLEVAYYAVTPNGVTKHTERTTVIEPVFHKKGLDK